MSFAKNLLGGLCMAAATSVAAPAHAVPYSDLYVFGDSLVDAGNVFVLTGGTTPDPAEGYFEGRFTNGPDFTDLLGAQITGSFTTPSLLGGNNFAFGGARIVDNGGIPDLDLQVATYLTRSGGTADPDALYAINVAGNDIFALQRGDTAGLSEEEYLELATNTVVANVQQLSMAGAGNILLMGVPNAGVPVAIQLENMILSQLAAAEIEAELFNFSYFDFFGTVMNNPSALGLPPQDLTTTCMEARPVVDGEIDCTGIFSFDGVHFTAEIHEPLFREVADLVGVPVPEPAAFLLLGLGALTLAARQGAAAARSARRT